ncbi:MAG TPA: RNA 3'-terminal phosphate cyclase [Myxococcota bacterium]|nr:RNA 3'-terminal phosphate cyclase [Myxococcota bacterium]
MNQLIEIDGSHGEGGGQILRSALSLSLMTGLPFRMSRVRAQRAKPGLMRQHLACVVAAQQVSGAKVRGAELGSTELEFHPGPLLSGEYVIEIGSAGSTTLVAQALLPAFIAKRLQTRLVIHGGTHNPMAPPFSALEHVVAPLVRKMGVPIDVTLRRPGFAPMGGGIIEVVLGHRNHAMTPLVLTERGRLESVTLEVMTVSLPDDIARRELDVVRARLRATLGDIPMTERHLSPSKNHWQVSSVGNAVAVLLHFAHHSEEVSVLGERRLSAERVAAIVTDKALDFLTHGQPVGEHLQDQLPILLTATCGGRYRTHTRTMHLASQLDLIPRFTGQAIQVSENASGVTVEVPALHRNLAER